MGPIERRRNRPRRERTGGPSRVSGAGGLDPASIRANRRRLERKQRIARRRAAALGVLTLCVALVAVLAVLSLDSESGLTEGLDPQPATESAGASEGRSAAGAVETRTGARDLGLAGTAYASLSQQLPGIAPESVEYAQVSLTDPNRAAVWFPVPAREGRDRQAVFFLERSDEGWGLKRSVLAGDEEFPRDLRTLLTEEPQDLVRPVFSREAFGPENPSDGPEELAVRHLSLITDTERKSWRPESVESEDDLHVVRVVRAAGEDGGVAGKARVYVRGSGDEARVVGVEPGGGEGLTSAELSGFPGSLVPEGEAVRAAEPRFSGTEPVYDGGARNELEERGVEQAVEVVERYPGIVGFYALDLRDGSGFGVRPDEEFFSASTIKVAVMAAVYRKIDAGELEYSDELTTTDEDWAAGAGWLRWETPGAKATVEDALWLMMTESDNVATNVLTRAVGGPEYVNEVIRDLGAKDTELFWKLTSERAAVPELDNNTTPRDMTTLLSGIYNGEGFKDFSRREMVDLMGQNNLEYWLEGGLPPEVKAANKGGWLDGSYNDVGIVRYEESPYALAIYTMNGPVIEEGQGVLSEVSEAVWLARSGETKEEFESRDAGEDSPAPDAAEKNRSSGRD